jgi:hypothetical protein
VVALSPRSTESDQVRKEIDIADEARKPVVPVVIRQTTVPKHLMYQLIGWQQIDLTADFKLGVRELIDSLRRLAVSPQSFASLSREARNEIKQLATNSALSTTDKVSLVSIVLVKESDRVREKMMAQLLANDGRAAKRMELKDRLHRAGNYSEMESLDAEAEEDKRKLNLVLEEQEQMQKIQQLVLSQLREMNRSASDALGRLWK